MESRALEAGKALAAADAARVGALVGEGYRGEATSLLTPKLVTRTKFGGLPLGNLFRWLAVPLIAVPGVVVVTCLIGTKPDTTLRQQALERLRSGQLAGLTMTVDPKRAIADQMPPEGTADCVPALNGAVLVGYVYGGKIVEIAEGESKCLS